MGIVILTDSAADLPQPMYDDYNIEMISLHVYSGEEEYLDGRTLQPQKLFAEMRQGKVFKTAQAEPAVFKDHFERYAKRGDSCLYVGFSSGLSSTYQSAALARSDVLQAYPGCQIALVDTKCASLGQGLVVYQAAKWAKETDDLDELAARVEAYARRMQHIFTVDDLEYLYRGGRVSRTTAWVGGILNIKPILHVVDGKLVPLEKVRGKNKVIRRMVEIMGERGSKLQEQTVGISHGDDLDAANKLMEAVTEAYGCQDFIISSIGCAIGAHSGPGTLALFFLTE
ncbi:MAG: DegV family protein [Firmicutes bacterium]|nr:DegV family protein [Bacillota bacterium]